MHFLLLLAQNLPTELKVCPHPQTHRVGVFWDQNPGGLAVSQVKILLEPSEQDSFSHLLYKVLRLTSEQVQDLNGWMKH